MEQQVTILYAGRDYGSSFFARSVLFKSEEDVRKAGIMFVGEEVDWDSQQARELVEIVKPSTKQINFSIGAPQRQAGKLIDLCCC